MADRIENQTLPAEPPPNRVREEEPAPRRGFVREHPAAVVIGAVVLVALLIGGVFAWRYLQSYETTDDAEIDGHIDAVSSRITGTITAVYVVENQQVKQGQLLITIDPADYQVALERAKADLAQAQAQVQAENPNVPITSVTNAANISTTQEDVSNVEAGVSGAQRDYEAALAKIQEAEANNVKAQADVARYKLLVDKQEISRQQYDANVAAAKAAAATVESYKASAEAARHAIDQQKARLEQARTRVQQASTNAPQQLAIRRANVVSKQASVEAAKAALNQAELNLSYTRILAPVTGVIGKKNAEVGMQVSPGEALLAVIPLDDIWITANFKETQLRRMRAQQPVRIHVDAFGRDYDGYVESFPGASGGKFSLMPAENATGNYVKVVQRLPVRIRFKPGQDDDHRLRPGMSVEPKVLLQ